MVILGIETSCDETAAAVIDGSAFAKASADKRGDSVKVLSNVVSSQIEIHKKYGGVVPEVAAREHVLNILPVVDEAIEKAGIIPPASPARAIERQAGPFIKGANRIEAIAVTVGPGLVTSLLVGVETAKALGYVWRVPILAINHIEGHIYANFIDHVSAGSQIKPKFPAIILTVSGGHTMLVFMSGHGKYQVLGETRDDAAGEAFDKAAKLLGLGYPGGPAMAAEAAKFKPKLLPLTPPLSRGIVLPRPMINSGDFDFSFSGLKTALFYQLQKDRRWRRRISAYAAEFQQAVVEVLVAKTIKAAKTFGCQTVMLAGGVAANLELRHMLKAAVKEKLTGVKLIIPEFKYCTDNAAMIAVAGYYRASAGPLRRSFSEVSRRRKDFTPWQKLKTEPNKELA